jgi:hypothetical protein
MQKRRINPLGHQCRKDKTSAAPARSAIADNMPTTTTVSPSTTRAGPGAALWVLLALAPTAEFDNSRASGIRLAFALALRNTSAMQRPMRLAGIIISLAMLVVDSEARDRGQFAKSTPEMKKWFDGLKSKIGSCCSDADGTALSDVDWESKDGHYRVRLNGQWIDVPDNALVTEPNLTGRTMIWLMPQIDGDTIKIRCFMPGTMI